MSIKITNNLEPLCWGTFQRQTQEGWDISACLWHSSPLFFHPQLFIAGGRSSKQDSDSSVFPELVYGAVNSLYSCISVFKCNIYKYKKQPVGQRRWFCMLIGEEYSKHRCLHSVEEERSCWAPAETRLALAAFLSNKMDRDDLIWVSFSPRQVSALKRLLGFHCYYGIWQGQGPWEVIILTLWQLVYIYF